MRVCNWRYSLKYFKRYCVEKSIGFWPEKNSVYCFFADTSLFLFTCARLIYESCGVAGTKSVIYVYDRYSFGTGV